jgi:hypothetical protein
MAKFRGLLFVCALLFLAIQPSLGKDVYVKGHFRSNGTYVAPHHRSRPDGNFYNNWSTKGNVNPYTGKLGTKVSPPSSRTSSARRSGGATAFPIGVSSASLTPSYAASSSSRSSGEGSRAFEPEFRQPSRPVPVPKAEKSRALPGEIPLTYTSDGRPLRDYSRWTFSY